MTGVKNKKGADLEKLKNKDLDVDKILGELIKYLCIHIKNQISAGADVVQIFDSWAGLIPKEDLKNFVLYKC